MGDGPVNRVNGGYREGYGEGDPAGQQGSQRVYPIYRDYRVRETLLSRKPRQDSLRVTTVFVLLVVGTSLAAWRNGGALLPVLDASRAALEQHQYWRLLTAVGVHADLEHLFSNLIFLAPLCYLLYGYFGFWVFPALGLALAVLTNYLSLLTYPPGVGLVGASGLVYWMAAFWLSMYLLVERTLSTGKRVVRAIGIALVILLPTSFQAHVAYRVHGIGFVLGVIAAFVYYRRNREVIRAMEVLEIEPEDEW